MGGQRDNQAQGRASCRVIHRAEVERRAARLAARQHGVLTRRQLRALGFTQREIDRRLEAGRLRRLHRGVYLVGPIKAPLAREMAAVLACGPNAALSHRSAACVWKLLPHPASSLELEVIVPGRNPGTRPGIRVHRLAAIHQDEVTTKHGIPVTTPPRTLLDLAAHAATPELEQAIAEAFAKRLANRPRLLSLIARHPRHRGAKALRGELQADRAPARIRSSTEERLLRLIRRARLPTPDVNARLGRWEVDFLWREQGLVVEADGYASHSSPRAFERDHVKAAELQTVGFTVIRVSWRQLRNEPETVLVLLARALGG